MSMWTHVNGSIRIDGLPQMSDKYTVQAVKKFLGNTCKFDSSDKEWSECNVPCGSEGSIQYNVFEYGTEFPWIIVNIWGDLRDYDNVEAIKEWFSKILLPEKAGVFPIRDAILQVSVEDGRNKIFVLSSENEKDVVSELDF